MHKLLPYSSTPPPPEPHPSLKHTVHLYALYIPSEHTPLHIPLAAINPLQHTIWTHSSAHTPCSHQPIATHYLNTLLYTYPLQPSTHCNTLSEHTHLHIPLAGINPLQHTIWTHSPTHTPCRHQPIATHFPTHTPCRHQPIALLLYTYPVQASAHCNTPIHITCASTSPLQYSYTHPVQAATHCNTPIHTLCKQQPIAILLYTYPVQAATHCNTPIHISCASSNPLQYSYTHTLCKQQPIVILLYTYPVQAATHCNTPIHISCASSNPLQYSYTHTLCKQQPIAILLYTPCASSNPLQYSYTHILCPIHPSQPHHKHHIMTCAPSHTHTHTHKPIKAWQHSAQHKHPNTHINKNILTLPNTQQNLRNIPWHTNNKNAPNIP